MAVNHVLPLVLFKVPTGSADTFVRTYGEVTSSSTEAPANSDDDDFAKRRHHRLAEFGVREARVDP